MFSRLVLATHNLKKAREMEQILGHHFPIATLADYPGAPEPPEGDSSYFQNAALKAISGAEFTGEACLADDAGLEIDALPGELGVNTKQFHGETTPWPDKWAEVLRRMEGVPEDARTARFRCVIALAVPRRETPQMAITCFTAVREGRIAPVPSGSGGFGYDPIFWLPDLGCTMADLSAEQKHATSHRGLVLAEFTRWLAERG